MLDDYIEWLLMMGLIQAANTVGEGTFTISDGCISYIGWDVEREITEALAAELKINIE